MWRQTTRWVLVAVSAAAVVALTGSLQRKAPTWWYCIVWRCTMMITTIMIFIKIDRSTSTWKTTVLPLSMPRWIQCSELKKGWYIDRRSFRCAMAWSVRCMCGECSVQCQRGVRALPFFFCPGLSVLCSTVQLEYCTVRYLLRVSDLVTNYSTDDNPGSCWRVTLFRELQ